jgi:hypothetical protein
MRMQRLVAFAVAPFVAVVLVIGLVVGLVVVSASSSNPGGATPGLACTPADGTAGGEFTDPRQIANAAAIVATGQRLGLPQQAWQTALATAMQEGRLLVWANERVPESLTLPHDRVGEDADSVGPFQQRPSQGWGDGDIALLMDPAGSSALFYEVLLAIPGWERLSLTEAAQRVQRSAFPNAYAQWEDDALTMIGAVLGVSCPTGGGGAPDSTLAAAVIERATSQIGTPYVWGGGDADGPTGTVPGGTDPGQGFDCSGLMVFAFAGVGVSVPHQTQAIWAQFAPPITDTRQVLAGDMLVFSSDGTAAGVHHVGLYLGEGRMVHAPRTGKTVEVVDVWSSAYWTGEFIGAVRAIPAAAPAPAAPLPAAA